MKKIEALLTSIAIVAIIAVAMTDPWVYENIAIILISLSVVLCTGLLGFIAGVEWGMKKAAQNANKTLQRALDEQALKLKRDLAGWKKP